MKKYLTAFFVFTLFLLSPTAALAATLSLSPATGTFNRGCDMSINIELDTTGTQTDGTDVILLYDPSKLSMSTSQITNGGIYPEYPGNSVDTASGKVSISGISSVASPYTGKGTFATLKFKVLENAPAGAITLKFDFDPNDKTKTVDSNIVERGTIADVLASVTDGTYTIGTGACGTAGGPSKPGGIGGPDDSATPAASPIVYKTPPPDELPDSGLFDNTYLLGAIGAVLTIVGIAGLALF